MNTQLLIERLAKDLQPVRRLDFGIWARIELLAVIMISGFPAVLTLPLRSNYSELHSNAFNIVLSTILFVSLSVLVSFLQEQSIPGSAFGRKTFLILSLTLPSLYFLFSAALDGTLSNTEAWVALPCTQRIIFLTILPGVSSTLWLRRGATVRPELIAGTLIGTILSVSIFLMQFSCEATSGAHNLFSHALLPAVVLTIFAFPLLKKIFSWT